MEVVGQNPPGFCRIFLVESPTSSMRGSAPLSHVDHQVMVMSELDSLREYKCMMAKRDKSLWLTRR